MRILFVCPRSPLPAARGDQLRAWQFIRHLADTHEVAAVAYAASGEEGEVDSGLRASCRISKVPLRPFRRWIRLPAAMCGSVPFQVALYTSREMASVIQWALDWADVVHLNTLRVAGNLPSTLDKPLIVDFVDALSAHYEQMAVSLPAVARHCAAIEARRLRGFEQSLAARASLAMASAPLDASRIGAAVQVVPNTVDLARFRPPDPDAAPRDGVVFTGNMNYPPNREAAQFLVRRIMPLVWRELPLARVRLVGAFPPAAVWRLATSRVAVTGWVTDMAAELRQAAVAVAPMLGGMGIKNKILEAMACATPVVGTPCANAGIAAQDEEAILLGETAEELAHRVVLLLRNPERASYVGAAGRSWVERMFSAERVQKQLLDLYARIS